MTFRNAFPHRLFGSCVACFLVLIVLISLSNRNEHLRSDLVKRSVKEDDNKVPVELYVMSKCPGNLSSN
ncbi:hypothetical protein K502DRAFT_326104 [Neoconidiobolus thromboides FSU 785]|nr:hypothetical protein K502DRAFT_326104 [Neoconidiobolus thromboides FSU 785]